MQPVTAFLTIFIAALLAGSPALAADAPNSAPAAAPPQSVTVTPLPSQEKPNSANVPAPAATTAPASTARIPHIALLLPLQSATFKTPADAVQQGFMAAANAQAPALPIKIYPTSDEVENILAVYQQALQAGAQVVVGPLTKNGVSALAASSMVNVPTLALNIPETEIATPKKLYLFGLAVEPEARQVARLAFAEGAKSALTVSARTPLAKRMQQAFADEWQMLGGTLGAQLTFSSAGNLEALHESVLKHPADVIFLAANVREARLVRPYLDAAIPTYATSQTYSDKAGAQKNIDLDGISFVDMPWLLQPDHPAVMVYPHPETSMNVDLERLYALGIDALRLTRLLLNGPPAPGSAILDGVTGKISLGADRQFTRELTPAQFKQDVVVVLDSPTP